MDLILWSEFTSDSNRECPAKILSRWRNSSFVEVALPVENAESFLLVSGRTASDSPSLVVLKRLGEMGAGFYIYNYVFLKRELNY